MAIAHVGNAGTATSKSSGTTLVLTVSASFASTDLAVVITSWDNTDTTIGDSTRLSCSDSSGNTYTKLREYTYSEGAAGDGATGAIFISRISSALTAGASSITLTSNTACTAKAVSVRKFTTGAAVALEQTQVGTANENQPPSLTTSGMTSRSYLHIRCDASEDNGDPIWAQDADYTDFTTANTVGGALVSNVTLFGGFRIATLTGDTAAPTGENRDRVAILAAIYETAGTDKAIVPAVVNAKSTVTGAVTKSSTAAFWTHLASNISGTNGTVYTIDASPSADSIVVLSVLNNTVANPPPSPTVTDSTGKTWTNVNTISGGTQRLGSYFAVFSGAAPGLVTFTATFATTQDAVALSVDQITGGHMTNPLVQSVTGSAP